MSAQERQVFDTRSHLAARHRTGKIWQIFFFLSTATAILALSILLLNILNSSMGLIITDNKVNPAKLADRPIEQLSSTELAAILQTNLTRLRLRQVEREKPLADRSQAELVQLVTDQVVQPKVVASYTLLQSIFQREQITTEAAEKYPTGVVTFKSWINRDFLTNSMSSSPELAGVRTALLGSLSMILLTISFAFPIGVGAAIYLEEYADRSSRINRILQTNIDNLAGVPSIVYGILGLAIFVRTFGGLTSGALFGVGDGNSRTILSASLTMALLILPILIINAQEAIRAVPNSLRQASYGLGATRWQTIRDHVLPYAMPGILTGTILAVSRAIGETAPLILVGASTFITQDPTGPFSRFTALPIQIYNWTTRPQDQFRNAAGAAIVILLISLLLLNAVAILLRNRFSRR